MIVLVGPTTDTLLIMASCRRAGKSFGEMLSPRLTPLWPLQLDLVAVPVELQGRCSAIIKIS